MRPEDLSPQDREIAQLALLRLYLARKKRAAWAAIYGKDVPVKRYDLQGRRILDRR